MKTETDDRDPRNVGNLPNDMVSYHRTLESSLTLLCEPHILQNAITIFITQYDFSIHSILSATLSGHTPVHVCRRNRDKPIENGRNIREATLNSVLQVFLLGFSGNKTRMRHYNKSKHCLLTHFLIFYSLVWRSMLERFCLLSVQTKPRKINLKKNIRISALLRFYTNFLAG